MRIDVLNGVNLDLLGRRDPAIYGEQSLQDLETQIYAWARELDLQVRCRQTNHEGEYVEFLHQALGTAGRADRQPRRLDALLVGDPRRARAVHGAVRRGAPLERRRARGVAPALGARGPRRHAGRRQGLRRLPRGARSAGGASAREPARAPRRSGSDEPLLVTDGVNVRYLTGFESSNCALLVEPAGRDDALHRLPLRRGRARGRRRRVRADAPRRRERARRAPRRAGASGSRRRGSRTRSGRRSRAVAPSSSRPAASSRRCALVKDDGELDAIRRAAARSRTRSTRALARGAARRTHRGRGRLVDRAHVPRARRRRARVRHASSRPARTARGRTRIRATT